jgi:hypothetical protein
MSDMQLRYLTWITCRLQATDARAYRDAMESRLAGPHPNLISGQENRAMASLKRYCAQRVEMKRELARRDVA